MPKDAAGITLQIFRAHYKTTIRIWIYFRIEIAKQKSHSLQFMIQAQAKMIFIFFFCCTSELNHFSLFK